MRQLFSIFAAASQLPLANAGDPEKGARGRKTAPSKKRDWRLAAPIPFANC